MEKRGSGNEKEGAKRTLEEEKQRGDGCARARPVCAAVRLTGPCIVQWAAVCTVQWAAVCTVTVQWAAVCTVQWAAVCTVQ